MKIEIDQKDFGTICICALRYCHGRRSYMPSLVQRIVRGHLDSISDNDVKVMINDCQFQRNMNLYGDECDKVDWLKWEQTVKEEMERRESDE